jgi:hypothetical protein
LNQLDLLYLEFTAGESHSNLVALHPSIAEEWNWLVAEYRTFQDLVPIPPLGSGHGKK